MPKPVLPAYGSPVDHEQVELIWKDCYYVQKYALPRTWVDLATGVPLAARFKQEVSLELEKCKDRLQRLDFLQEKQGGNLVHLRKEVEDWSAALDKAARLLAMSKQHSKKCKCQFLASIAELQGYLLFKDHLKAQHAYDLDRHPRFYERFKKLFQTSCTNLETCQRRRDRSPARSVKKK